MSEDRAARSPLICRESGEPINVCDHHACRTTWAFLLRRRLRELQLEAWSDRRPLSVREPAAKRRHARRIELHAELQRVEAALATPHEESPACPDPPRESESEPSASRSSRGEPRSSSS